jgi:protein-disulfide isomerase
MTLPIACLLASACSSSERGRRAGNATKKSRQSTLPEPFKEATISIEGAPVLGNRNAKVALIEYTDYQCPYCARHFRETRPRILADYVNTGLVKYIQEEFPLESKHPQALSAAEGALCAGDSGKYWEMHDKLFANSKALQFDDMVKYATSLGLDPGAFRECVESGKHAATIREHLAEARKAGVIGTPSFLLGRTDPAEPTSIKATQMITGAVPFARFKAAIDSLLSQNGKTHPSTR